MKSFLTLVLLQIVASVNCAGVEKVTEFGKKGEKDILLYNEVFNVYKPTLDRFLYITFPPKGLISHYTVTNVKVIDYNPFTATVSKEAGDVGLGEITISIKAPVLKSIEAAVEIYGTFNGPCDNNKKSEEQ